MSRAGVEVVEVRTSQTVTSPTEVVTVGLVGPQGPSGSGSAAPTDATYLVATAHSSLSAEIPVGTTPGGELGGTWDAPTVDATHSGSSHASIQSAAEATAASALASHEADTTAIHGIANTANLVLTSDSRLSDARTPTAHNHAASEITSGTVATARLGSGTASSSTYLRGDQTWATVAGGGGSGDVVGPSASVDGEIALYDSTTGKLLKRASATGIAKLTSGVLSAATAGTDYYAPGSTDVMIADGGTGASDAATARTNLGLGTIATQAASNVLITGGSVTGITDLAIADGGTGASTATAAFNALSPTTTAGDIMFHDGTNDVRLPKGAANTILRMNNAVTAPEWGQAPRVFFHDAGTIISSSSGWATETTDTSMLTTTGTISANTIAAGDTFLIRASGKLTNNSGGSVAYVFTLPFGGTVTTGNLAAGSNARLWVLDLSVYCPTIGGAGVAGQITSGFLTITATTTATVDTIVTASTFIISEPRTNATTSNITLDMKIRSGSTTDTQSAQCIGFSAMLLPKAA